MSPVDFRIGNTIRMLRIVRGLSQQALARRLNVTFQQVQKYEKAKTHIASSRLYEIARVLDTPIEVFFGSQGIEGAAQIAIRDMVDRYDRLSPQFGYHEFVELNRAFVGISHPAVRDAVLNLVIEIALHSPPETQIESELRSQLHPPLPESGRSPENPENARSEPATDRGQVSPATEAEPA